MSNDLLLVSNSCTIELSSQQCGTAIREIFIRKMFVAPKVATVTKNKLNLSFKTGETGEVSKDYTV
jgi:hypothetical protein